MGNRYERNMNTFSEEENSKFSKFNICVVGCGGLGGYAIEMLARLGIGNITGVDGDVFEENNLNRQILSTERVLGLKKALVAKERILEINSQVKFNPITVYIDNDNAKNILEGHNLVIDALDNMNSRRVVAEACRQLEIPLIHGAIAGWYGQVSAIMPGDNTFDKIYPSEANKGSEVELGNPSFAPSLVASIQVAEAIKVLLNKEHILQNKLLTLDLLNHEYEIFEL